MQGAAARGKCLAHGLAHGRPDDPPNLSSALARAPGARVLTAQADAINLHTGDVPGMSVTSYGSEVPPNAIGVQLRRCGGALPDWEAGSLRSAKFAPQSLSHLVWSAIRVVPSPTVAVRDLAGNRTARVRTCVARVFGAVLAQRGPLVHERTSALALPTDLRGEGSFGLRLIHRVSLREAHPHPPEHGFAGKLAQTISKTGSFSLDIFGVASGRFEITLMDLHDPGLAPVQSEKRLLLLLYGRAKAHKL